MQEYYQNSRSEKMKGKLDEYSQYDREKSQNFVNPTNLYPL